ncbi:MAG: CbiX/SirB N-terminal domain-containing protein [Proteobacteria bacterium]|nr:CbiX/SirB N-terminal domain-containing protein [Pseudomonadota bacterium]HOL36543.1 CbiX/SirB N-terminal domain-containing protein [Rubrivivax sp.]
MTNAAPGIANAAADALILFAHGARDPRWAAPFEAVAAAIGAARPALRVRLAYLECMAPNLPRAGAELVAAGARAVHVVPVFLGAGGHVREDVPRLLDALRRTHPQAAFTLHPAIGEIDAVVQAMARAIVATVEDPR